MRKVKEVMKKMIPISGINEFEVSRNNFELISPSVDKCRWIAGQKNGSDENAPFFIFLQKKRSYIHFIHKTIAMYPYVFQPPKKGTWGDFYDFVSEQIQKYLDGDNE